MNALSLFLRNLFFTVLQPGIVAGLVPYFIVTYDGFVFRPLQLTNPVDILSLIFFVVGILITILCIIRFGTHGRGTLSPVDPTKVLVVSGLYRYSRNPMYVGVLLILISEEIFTQNIHMVAYTIGFIIAVNIFVIFHEEPRLRRDFGDAYLKYCDQVRRWI